MNDIRVYLKKVHEEAVVPTYAYPGDACCDLATVEAFTIKPGERYLADTGLQIAMPEGFEAQIRPRSGQAWKRGLTVVNSPGTVDSHYRFNIKVALINLGQEELKIEKGERIAQMKFSPVYTAHFIETTNLEETVRGTNGFGSSGR